MRRAEPVRAQLIDGTWRTTLDGRGLRSVIPRDCHNHSRELTYVLRALVFAQRLYMALRRCNTRAVIEDSGQDATKFVASQEFVLPLVCQGRTGSRASRKWHVANNSSLYSHRRIGPVGTSLPESGRNLSRHAAASRNELFSSPGTSSELWLTRHTFRMSVTILPG